MEVIYTGKGYSQSQGSLVPERPQASMVLLVLFIPLEMYAAIHENFSVHGDIERRCRIFQVHQRKSGSDSSSKRGQLNVQQYMSTEAGLDKYQTRKDCRSPTEFHCHGPDLPEMKTLEAPP